MTGTIKKPQENKTYGFILSDEGAKDVFFHESELQGVTLQELKEGDKVTFELVEGVGGKGPSAKGVSRAE